MRHPKDVISAFEIPDFRRLVATGRYTARRVGWATIEVAPADRHGGLPSYRLVLDSANPFAEFVRPDRAPTRSPAAPDFADFLPLPTSPRRSRRRPS